MATEWAQDVTRHVARFALPYQDPKSLDPIDIEDDQDTKIYQDGKLHHLKRFETNVTGIEALNETYLVNITLQFRLLRTSYVWKNFFSDGILSMYHTCGTPLPMTIFDVSFNFKVFLTKMLLILLSSFEINLRKFFRMWI